MDPPSLASPRSLYVLGLGMVTFVSAGLPVGILVLAVPAGVAAIALGSKECRAVSTGPKSRWLSLAGMSFAILGFTLAAAWIYVGVTYATMFGAGDQSIDPGGLLCTVCEIRLER